MNCVSRISIIFCIIGGLMIILSIAGCEPYQVITHENRTTLPVKIFLDVVPLDSSGTTRLSWDDPAGVVIATGESKRYVTNVPDNRKGGINYKYIVVAVTESKHSGILLKDISFITKTWKKASTIALASNIALNS